MRTRKRRTELFASRCARRISRRRLLRIGGASVAGTALFGIAGCGGGSDEPSGSTRIIEHRLGTTEVPLNPQRVVILDSTPAEAAITLGVKPVGVNERSIGEGFYPQMRGALEGAESTGTAEQPNLETIAALEPDLILSGFSDENLHERLSQIAPSVADGAAGEDWKEDMRLVARALGREERMEEELAAYEERVAEFKRSMGERLEEPTVSLAMFYDESFRIYMPGSYMGQIVEEAGLKRPEAQLEAAEEAEDGEFAIDPSNEELPLVDADVIFAMHDPVTGNDYRDRLLEEDNPLFRNLGAVESDRVYDVSWDAWLAGRGIISANIILDDLDEYLLEERP